MLQKKTLNSKIGNSEGDRVAEEADAGKEYADVAGHARSGGKVCHLRGSYCQ